MAYSFINPLEIIPTLRDPLESSDPELQERLNRVAVEICCRPRQGSKRKRESGGNHKYHPTTKANIVQDAKVSEGDLDPVCRRDTNQAWLA